VLLVGSVVALFVLTDPAPSADMRNAPTAQQVGAGRDAVYQLRNRQKAIGGASRIDWGPEHLEGLSVLATQGFRPNRLDLYIFGDVFYVVASYKLPLDRWFNVNLAASGRSAGFPETSVRIGSLPLSPFFARGLFEVGRWVLRLQGTQLAPLDELVSDFAVGKESVAATIDLPSRTGMLDQLTGAGSDVDPALVVERYCALTKAWETDPNPDFAAQIRRAFPAQRATDATPATNRAAFIALGMFVVDRRVGFVAKVDDGDAARCAKGYSSFDLHTRSDLPKHWALSAALAAGTGSQLAAAMGEWKELADSLAKGSRFARGAPTGFSFVDLAADRSGFRIANAASSDKGAQDMAARLSRVAADQLLPRALLNEAEGLRGADFRQAYGGIEDPRYLKAVARIDAVLQRDGLVTR